MTAPFDPDWTLAPSAMLAECDTRGRLDRPADLPHGDLRLFAEVIARMPLGTVHADLLAMETGVPAAMWLRWEARYRADLAAGRKDWTDE